MVYLNLPRVGATEVDRFLDGLGSGERTALTRLRSSLSERWTPARIHAKVRALGFEGDDLHLAVRFITDDSYDPGAVMDQEIKKRLARGQGRQKIIMGLLAEGFDRPLVEEKINGISRETWMEILNRHLQEGLPADPVERKKAVERLQRRGFSVSQIAECMKSRRES